jgi:spore germination protein
MFKRLYQYMRTQNITFAFYACAFIFICSPLVSQAATRTLTVGMSGADVSTLQQELISRGYLSGSATGTFGPLTLAGVKSFQCAKGIVCSGSSYGVAGPQTQAALAGGASLTDPQSNLTGKSLTGPNTKPFEFSGWLPYWRAASSTLDVTPHLQQLNSVMPFGYTVRTDGTLNDAMHILAEPWVSFIATAKADHVRVIPSVMWGDGASEQAILSDPTAHVALEDQIANLVKQQNFDGIDIDFEAKTVETRDAFSTFLKGLYQRMGTKYVYCTIEARMPLSDRYDPGATIPADATDHANDYVQMNKYCDRVEIMAYDQGSIDVSLNKQQTGPYSPVADPKWVSDLVKLAAQSIAKNKIIIGVPTYGYEFTTTPVVATTTTAAYQYQVLWPFNPTYASDLATKLGISAIRNSAGELSFSYHSSGNYAPTGDQTDTNPTNTFAMPAVSYTDGTSTVATAPPFNFVDWSDAQAIAQKVALARQLGVRGVAVFKLDGGEDQNIWSVLK